MADLGGYEGVRQAPLPGLPRSPRPAYSAKRWRTLPNSSPPHRSRRRHFVTSCPGGPLLSPPHRRLQPLRLLVAEGALLRPSTSAPARPQQQPSQWPQHGAGRREAARPASAPAKPVKCQGRRRPWDGRPGASGSCSSGDGDSTTPSPGGGPGREFLFCSTTGPHSHPLLSSPVGSRVRSEDARPSPAPPAQPWSQVSVAPHTQTPLRDALPFESGPWAPLRCPHRGYVYVSPGPACTAPGGLARVPQAVSLAPEDHQTRLCDSVRPASSQVQGQSVHLSVEPGCPCLACRSRGPTGEGRDTAGPSSRDGVRALQRPLLHRSQETRWVTSNLGPACSEPGPCQAPVQDVDAETPLSMRPSLRLGLQRST